MSHTVRKQCGCAVPLLLSCVMAALSGCGGSASAAPDPHGIGTVCDANIDCNAGLFCNTDPVIAAPHGQCTDACGDSAASCVQQAGPFTVCTAGVC
ncbi:MAG: hypothetical protein ABI548_18530, partial [Polyangiaceae bacterium]